MPTKAVRLTMPLVGEANPAGYLVMVPGASVLIRQNGVALVGSAGPGTPAVFSDNDKTAMTNPVPTGVTPGTAGVDTEGRLLVYLNPGKGYDIQATVGNATTTAPLPDVGVDVEDVQAPIESGTYADSPTPGVPRTAVATSTDQTVAGVKTWVGMQYFRASEANGGVADFSGTIADAAPAGGSFYRASMALEATGGTNGVRGDSIASDSANGDGATSFNGFYSNVTGGTAFAGKGSLNQYVAFGTLAPYSGGGDVYGELGAFISSLTNNRTGGLLSGHESTVNSGTAGAPVQGRNSAFTGVVNEHNAALTYWSRGFWAPSGGSQKAGDAFYADGDAGWRNFLNFRHTDGTQRFRVDETGKIFLGAGARELFDNGSGLQTNSQFVVGNSIYTSGGIQTPNVLYTVDGSVQIVWYDGNPEGVVTASKGSILLNLSGGAGTTLYIKETGTGNTGWAAK